MGVSLPPEILTIICELCTKLPGLCKACTERYTVNFCCIKRACMALRLVSRDWNAASTPFVFDHIKLRLFPSSVEKFDELCHSELAKHVRTLDFHPDLLPVWDKETWLSNVRYRAEGWEATAEGPHGPLVKEAYDEITRHSLSIEELDIGWAAYEKHMLGQQRWRRTTADLRTMLKHTLSRLPNLRQATVTCCPSPYELRRNLFMGFSQDPFLGSIAREIIAPSKTWLVSLTATQSTVEHVELEDTCTLACVAAIAHRYIHSAVKPVKTLTLDLKSRQTLRNLLASSEHAEDVSIDYESKRREILHAFNTIADLTLRVREAAPHASENDAQTEDMRQILQAARSVRTLRLEYGNFFDDETYFLRAHYIMPQFALMPLLANPKVTYPHLKELFISAAVPGNALAGFLRLHSPALKSLGLRRSISDDWETVLHAVAEHLELDHLYLYWLVEGYHSYVDGESWRLRMVGPSVTHFNFEQHLYWDGTAEYTRRLDCVQFKKAMRRFFDGNGSLELPQEYHNEWENLRQWKGPITQFELEHNLRSST